MLVLARSVKHQMKADLGHVSTVYNHMIWHYRYIKTVNSIENPKRIFVITSFSGIIVKNIWTPGTMWISNARLILIDLFRCWKKKLQSPSILFAFTFLYILFSKNLNYSSESHFHLTRVLACMHVGCCSYQVPWAAAAAAAQKKSDRKNHTSITGSSSRKYGFCSELLL